MNISVKTASRNFWRHTFTVVTIVTSRAMPREQGYYIIINAAMLFQTQLSTDFLLLCVASAETESCGSFIDSDSSLLKKGTLRHDLIAANRWQA